MFSSRTFLSLELAWAVAFALAACKPYDAALLRAGAKRQQEAGSEDADAPGADAGALGEAGPGVCVPRPETCNRTDDDCDGTSDEDTRSVCEGIVLNADTDCVPFGKTAGCLLLACRAGYEDCDGNPANGCEPSCTCHDCGDGGAEPDAG